MIVDRPIYKFILYLLGLAHIGLPIKIKTYCFDLKCGVFCVFYKKNHLCFLILTRLDTIYMI